MYLTALSGVTALTCFDAFSFSALRAAMTAEASSLVSTFSALLRLLADNGLSCLDLDDISREKVFVFYYNFHLITQCPFKKDH